MLLFSRFNIPINLPNHSFLKIGQTHFCPVAQEFSNKLLLLYLVGWNKTNKYYTYKIDMKRITCNSIFKNKNQKDI